MAAALSTRRIDRRRAAALRGSHLDGAQLLEQPVTLFR
jgi:hypothetical protein